MSHDPAHYLTGNTRQDVKAIAKQLLWSGVQPTGARIREVIGKGPSQTTVMAALKEFYEEHGEYLRNNGVPPRIQEACEEIAHYVAETQARYDVNDLANGRKTK